jgi:SAM-dependent methyltransferase
MERISTRLKARNSDVQPMTVPYAGLARVYDAMLGNRFFSRARRNFERLRRRYGLHPQSAADVACGTGSFVRYLSCLGVQRVFGVDCSAEMLCIAMAKNRGNSVRFLCQDFHSLRLPEPVDLITCNFDSLNYLLSEGDLLLALQRFYANLAPGGVAIFDLITLQQPWGGSRPLEERRIWPGGEFWRRMHLDPRSGLQTSLVHIRLGGRTYRERHRQRAYPFGMIGPLLRRAGFGVLEAGDFYTWRAVNSQTRRIVVVAQKLQASL